MISVLNANPVPIQKETYAQLEQMGFTSDAIQHAFSKSQDKSVSGLLNWMLENENALNTALKESSTMPKPVGSENNVISSKKKSKHNKRHKNSDNYYLSMRDEEELLKKLASDIVDDISGVPSKIYIAKPKKKGSLVNDELTQKQLNPKITSPQSCPIRPQRLSPPALAEVKRILSELEIGNSINSHEITKCVNDVLSKWKYSSKSIDAEIVFALSFEELREDPLLSLRSKLYQLVDKVFNMRIRKDAKLDFSAIETVLMNSHDIGVFSKNQFEKLKISYIKFCRKMKVAENDMLIVQLEKASGGNGRKVMNKFSLNSPEIKPEPIDEGKLTKLTRLSDDEDSDSRESEMLDGLSQSEKELCVICMDRIREVVYLPCSHFLTCPLCSPCLKDCPICSKKIEKYLKIYWC